MSLHSAYFYFCILTAGFKGAKNPKLFIILCGDSFLSVVIHHMINLNFYKTGDGTKQFWGDDMEEMGIVRRSKSPWASPLHVVSKPGENGDYRHLNASTDDDRYPLPHFSRFQQSSCCLQSLLKNRPGQGLSSNSHGSISIARTALITQFGLWECLRMPILGYKTLHNRSSALWRASYATYLSRSCTSMTSWLLVLHQRITHNTSHNSFSSFPRMAWL